MDQRETTMPSIQFGFCVPIFSAPGVNLFRTPGFEEVDAAAAIRLARRADELGYDSLWVADHLMLGKDDAILEGWTVLAALAGATSRARLGMIHEGLLFRNPALAAKMAATLDQISGGRLIHFADCGYMGREYLAYGFHWDSAIETRIDKLAEATELTLRLWEADAPLTYRGRHYSVTAALCNPKPLQRPHPPLWFGEDTPGVLDLCARYGQGWNTTPEPVAEVRRRIAALQAACDRAGRPIDEITLSLETQILIAPDIATLRERLRELAALADRENRQLPPEIQPFLHTYAADADFRAFIAGETDELPARMAEDWLIGTPDQIDEHLRAYISEGISHFMLWFMDAPRTDGLDLFAQSVASRFRPRSS